MVLLPINPCSVSGTVCPFAALRRFGLLSHRVSEIIEEDAIVAVSKLGFTWQHFRAAIANDYDEIFARVAAEHFDAAYITSAPLNV